MSAFAASIAAGTRRLTGRIRSSAAAAGRIDARCSGQLVAMCPVPIATIEPAGSLVTIRQLTTRTTGTGTADITRPRLGLSEKANKVSLDCLQSLLASEFMLYMLLRDAHWSVQSPAFKELHVFLEELYTHADSVVDEVAERIRTLGGQASVVPSELAKASIIKEPPRDFHKSHAHEIVRRVADDTEAVIHHMRDCVRRIDDSKEDQGSIDYLGSTLRAHEKNVWMLRAHLGS